MNRNSPTACLMLLLTFSVSITSIAQTQPASTCTEKVSAPKAKYAPDPEPPSSWIGHKKSAMVVLEILIDKKGKVREEKVVSSEDAGATKNTLETVKRWRFKPAMCGKEPVESHINVEVRTQLF